MRRLITGFALAVVVAASSMACSEKNGSPTAPGIGTGGSGRCREVATGFTTLTGSTANSVVETTVGTCNFSRSANQLSCTLRVTDTAGGASTIASVATYASIADFVAEVSVVPPLQRWQTMTSAGVTVTNTFDVQQRLTRSASPSLTTTYTAWDSAGRPTSGSFSGNALSGAQVISYNDSNRTQTTVSTSARTTTCVLLFDVNGNPISSSCTGAGIPTVTASTTTTSTEQVCQ